MSGRVGDSAEVAGLWGTAGGGGFEPHAAKSATDVQSRLTVIAVLQSHRARATSIDANFELKATRKRHLYIQV